VARLVLYALAGGALLVAILWVLGQLGAGPTARAARLSLPPPSRAAGAGELAGGKERARDLAAEGHFAEAIHELLRTALTHLESSRAVTLEPSTTSREALRSGGIQGEGRSALTDLVLAVELSRFGDEAPGDDDYRRCLDSYDKFEAWIGR